MLCQQEMDDFERLVEPVEPLLQGRQRDPIRLVFLLEPPGAEPEVEAATGYLVNGCHRVGHNRRMSVGVRGDHVTQPEAGCHSRQGADQRPGFHAWSGAVGEQRVEVIEQPTALVDLDVVGGAPDLDDLPPR